MSTCHGPSPLDGVFQVQSILEVMGEGRNFDAALLEITGYTFKEFERNWLESMNTSGG